MDSPELTDRLTMLVTVGTRTEAHFLRSQVGIGSESHCLLGKLRRNFEISYSVADLNCRNSEVWLMEQVSEETVVERAARDRQSLDILSVKKR